MYNSDYTFNLGCFDSWKSPSGCRWIGTTWNQFKHYYYLSVPCQASIGVLCNYPTSLLNIFILTGAECCQFVARCSVWELYTNRSTEWREVWTWPTLTGTLAARRNWNWIVSHSVSHASLRLSLACLFETSLCVCTREVFQGHGLVYCRQRIREGVKKNENIDRNGAPGINVASFWQHGELSEACDHLQ